MKRKLFSVQVIFAALILCFISALPAYSLPKKVHLKAKLSEEKERMFWSITALDKNGQLATVYIQGTIHVGDERLFPLAPAVTTAWKKANRRAGEISLDDYSAMEEKVKILVLQSFVKANGRRLYDELSLEQVRALQTAIGKDVADQLSLFEPWVTTTALTSSIYGSSGLVAESGLDEWFITDAIENDYEVLGLDSFETQINLLRYGEYDEQLILLKDALDSLIEADDANVEAETSALFEAYLADNRKLLALLLKAEQSEEDEFSKNYNRMLYDERNSAWAKKIESWLNEGGTTFIFAGSAHFLGDNSVFAYLKKNGVL